VTTIRFYEARTRLSELLDGVQQGKKFLITRRSKPVALLVPASTEQAKDVRRVVKQMLEFRDNGGPTLGDKITVRDLIKEGRRF